MLSSEEICTIIKACGEAGVARLDVGGFHVEFFSKTPELPQIIEESADVQAIEQEQKEISKLSLQEEADRLKEDQYYQMVIEDPVQAEKLLLTEGFGGVGLDGQQEA